MAETNDEWCISTLKKLREAPPLSLKISLKSVSSLFHVFTLYFEAKQYQLTHDLIVW